MYTGVALYKAAADGFDLGGTIDNQGAFHLRQLLRAPGQLVPWHRKPLRRMFGSMQPMSVARRLKERWSTSPRFRVLVGGIAGAVLWLLLMLSGLIFG